MLKQRIASHEVIVRHVPDEHMPADFLTKWLKADKLEKSIKYATGSTRTRLSEAASAAVSVIAGELWGEPCAHTHEHGCGTGPRAGGREHSKIDNGTCGNVYHVVTPLSDQRLGASIGGSVGIPQGSRLPTSGNGPNEISCPTR